MPRKQKMRLIALTRETPAIFNYRFVSVDEPLFEYLSGQFVILNIPNSENSITPLRRSYSIASTPLDRSGFDLCIKINDHGASAPLLRALTVGQELFVEGPYGKFTLTPETETAQVFLVGSGSGLAPLRAMLQTIVKERREHRTTLIYGFRYEEDFAYHDELLGFVSAQVTIIPVASQPKGGWEGVRGHVQDGINKLARASFQNSSWYLCGPPEMVKQTQTLLEETGVPNERIKREMFE